MSDYEQIVISRNGTKLGSFSADDIKAGLVRGTLLPGDHYWHPGMTEWGVLRELFPDLCGNQPPPLYRTPHTATPAGQTAQTVIVNKVTVKNDSGDGCGLGCGSGCAIIFFLFLMFGLLGALFDKKENPNALPVILFFLLMLGIAIFVIGKAVSDKNNKDD